ncbi:GNAT family N-acetyltransferase [Streptomyces sp. BH-SS-21]|uniref:GNAT family N-acetyltransferase n=1 Tax=Streptomyces liliiviolaceus TaxID=2823109 RepID=A0A940Y4G0_9ACTN|nr:GNAT family N-acetyltransferase [Streptomyces liliiviolaceus]MBQ0855436.1 GNAT family N-acetyltransferase [Streptomyces liliiviolaceus]
MTNAISYHRYNNGEAADQLDTFISAYEEVYAEPPYSEGPRDVAEFIEHYGTHAARPGMRLVLAQDGAEIVGFTYGYYLDAETRWWRNLIDVKLPKEFMHETGFRTFVIIELAVRKAWRRRSIAAGLHTQLLDEVGAERVTLTVRPEPEATAAQSAYTAWGYQPIGTSHPWPDAPLYTCMVRELRKGHVLGS